MERVYSFQHSDHFEVQVGAVSWQGSGRWTDLSVMERKAIVRRLLLDNLKLQCAMEEEDGLPKANSDD